MVKNWTDDTKVWSDDKNKSNVVYTPSELSNFIYDILKDKEYEIVLDPAIGTGALTDIFYENNYIILGSDIEYSKPNCHEFIESDIDHNDFEFDNVPDLILMNPPFNGASGRRLFPEVFLRKIFEKYGYDIPVVMITGDNFLNNNRFKSKRRKWMIENNIEITSIITLPLDTFEDVLFNTQVLFFNIDNINPHYMF